MLEGRGRVGWAWQRSDCRDSVLVVGVVSRVTAVVHWAEGRRGQGSSNRSLGGREARASLNHLANLRDRSPLSWVELEDAPQNSIQLQGDGKDRPEELGVLHEGTEGAVLEGSTLPWVASTGQVDEDDSQAPNIVGRRGVAGVGLGC